MTMKEIRNEIARQRKVYPGCAVLIDRISAVVEDLWKDGYTNHLSNDILSLANGFAMNFDFGEEFFVNQTFDLRSITASKNATKAFAEFMLTTY